MTNAPEKITLSFYRYVNIEDPAAMMQNLRAAWEPLGVKGRTYVAHEGINAQVTVPVENKDAFCEQVRSVFPEIPFKFALEEKGEAFAKLKIKVRKKLVEGPERLPARLVTRRSNRWSTSVRRTARTRPSGRRPRPR